MQTAGDNNIGIWREYKHYFRSQYVRMSNGDTCYVFIVLIGCWFQLYQMKFMHFN